jgi:hypothetical protein
VKKILTFEVHLNKTEEMQVQAVLAVLAYIVLFAF